MTAALQEISYIQAQNHPTAELLALPKIDGVAEE
ncbi:MAG: hypothetical protein JWP22_2807 [Ramlibacter sp.]|jgi:hypothetical protein|nr:hypothetical protein [Ramlibacter sp.]MDB5914132.1 hypothetical protein [Ramlibacter sp.]